MSLRVALTGSQGSDPRFHPPFWLPPIIKSGNQLRSFRSILGETSFSPPLGKRPVGDCSAESPVPQIRRKASSVSAAPASVCRSARRTLVEGFWRVDFARFWQPRPLAKEGGRGRGGWRQPPPRTLQVRLQGGGASSVPHSAAAKGSTRWRRPGAPPLVAPSVLPTRIFPGGEGGGGSLHKSSLDWGKRPRTGRGGSRLRFQPVPPSRSGLLCPARFGPSRPKEESGKARSQPDPGPPAPPPRPGSPFRRPFSGFLRLPPLPSPPRLGSARLYSAARSQDVRIPSMVDFN